MTADDYQRALMQLLPTGLAWSQVTGSTLGKLLLALADDFVRADSNTEIIATRETMPGTSQWMLEDWEACLGLPDCGELADSVPQRQAAAQAKFTMAPSLNINFYEELALANGYVIKIEQLFPHHCLRSCMYPLIPHKVRFVAYVIVLNQVDYYRATCIDNCMTPLLVYESGELQCLLERYGPAHEQFIYYYPNIED